MKNWTIYLVILGSALIVASTYVALFVGTTVPKAEPNLTTVGIWKPGAKEEIDLFCHSDGAYIGKIEPGSDGVWNAYTKNNARDYVTYVDQPSAESALEKVAVDDCGK